MVVEKGEQKDRATIKEKEDQDECAAEEEEEWRNVSFFIQIQI